MDLYPDDLGPAYAAVLFVLIIVGSIAAAAGYIIWSWFSMKLFDKAGVQGRWRAWVPVYSQMIFFKLGDVNPWLVLFHFVWVVPVVGQILGSIVSLGVTVLTFMAAYRIGVKLGKDPAFTVLFLLAPIWLGIVAFDRSRWNPQVPPAPWAGTGFLRDGTRWEGIPVQTPVMPHPGYPASPGYPAAPGYQAPPAAPHAGGTWPAPPSDAPGAQPPTPPSVPPAPPAQPPLPPTQPPSPPSPPTQPPA